MLATLGVAESVFLGFKGDYLPYTPPSQLGPAGLPAVLQQGSLEVWVPYGRFRDYYDKPDPRVNEPFPWERLRTEFKRDYPQFDLHFRTLDRKQFHSVYKAASPDIAFFDNYKDLEDFINAKAVIFMDENAARFYPHGSWVIFRNSQHMDASQAFFAWLARSPHWKAWPLKSNTLSQSDRTDIQSVSVSATRYFWQRRVDALEPLLDSEAVRFSVYGKCDPKIGAIENLLTFGNSRLAFALLSTVLDGKETFGLIHNAVVLRKVAGQWKVLQLLEGSQPYIEQQLLTFDRIRLQEENQVNAPAVAINSPIDHARVPQFSNYEISWTSSGANAAAYLVEHQFHDPIQHEWAPSRAEFLHAPLEGPIFRQDMPFIAGYPPNRWRLVAIGRNGSVSFSDWRTIDFTN